MYLSLQYSKGNYARVDAAYSRSIRLVNMMPLRRSWAMSTMLSNLALMRLCQGYYDSAESLFAQAVDYVRKDKRLSHHYFAAILLNNLAVACLRQDKFIEAELLATEAMEIMDLKKNRSPKLNVIRALINGAHGVARLEHGELDDAERYLKKACQLHESEELMGSLGATTRTQAHVMCYFGLALVFARQKRLDDSERA
jgi:tetratricopeptide (TPR) repeat protein